MFDDDQQTPNTLNVAYEFNEGGKHKMLVFEVRHWDSNHEAGIGGPDGGKNLNTVGNTFYGPRATLPSTATTSTKAGSESLRRKGWTNAREGTGEDRGRQQLAQFHRGGEIGRPFQAE